jgi:hypothetical protein
MNWSQSINTNGGYFTDPIYIWGNTGTGSNGNGGFKAIGQGSWGDQTGYFNLGRDYFNGGTAKPGYTPYTYPHPLVGSVPGPELAAPTNLRGAP